MECFLGQLLLVPYTFDPVGWMSCDGRLLNISEYDALYALIGITYGGDGQTTFALPDLRGRVPIGTGASAEFGTVYPFASKGGCETVAVNYDGLPVHTHPLRAATGAASLKNPANAVLAAGPTIYAAGSSTAVTMVPASTMAGQNQPHENVGPYLPLRWMIAVEGIWPVQS